jgi:hypothetical protein
MGSPAGGGGGNNNNKNQPSTNQRVQNQLGKVGGNVNYNEAAAIAAKLGVSIDRVLNNTAKTGQNVKLGAAAVNAGYTGENTKVANDIYYKPQYQQAYYDQQISDLTNQLANPDGAFDWDAWTNEMNTRQQAVWDSMDQMNAEFMQQQSDFLAQQQASLASQGGQPAGPNRGSVFGGSGSPDPAAVKRKKKVNKTAGTTNPGLSTGGGSNNGLSIGGGGGNGQGLGLALGRNK